MLVVLDTTAIMSDPMCAGVAWRVLANARSVWDVHVYVPEVAVIEAVAGYQRRLAEAMVSWERWEQKHGRPLGLTDTVAAAEAALKEAASSYPARLRASLDELDATVLAPPAVDHTVIVQRAASRRRPCDDHGDGYRDTLNWLTVLSLASQYPDAQIAWVSDNSRDFGKDDGPELHEELTDELATVDAERRVRWIRTLPDLVLSLAAEHASEVPGDLKAIQARLRDEALSAFISTDVLAGTQGNRIDPRQCALPVVTASARIVTVGPPEDLHLTVRGAATANVTVVEFDLQADTVIQVETLPGITSPDATGSTSQLTKKLKFSGLITLDKYDRPRGGQLTRIMAMDDDPGRAQWDASALAALAAATVIMANATYADQSKFEILFPGPGKFDLAGPGRGKFDLLVPGPGKFDVAGPGRGKFDLLVPGQSKLDLAFPDLHTTMGTVSLSDLRKTAGTTTPPATIPSAEAVEPGTPNSAKEEIEGSGTEKPDTEH
jgi:hypothetical protein